MTDRPATGGRDEQQELRVAVVMNGGVSLAVWMGGVTRELDRVRRSEGPYGALARLARFAPRVDVIAGSSAGGINGAILAVAIARGSSVEPIRRLWMDQGAIGDLLRDPLRRDPPSLFKGDERLLPCLRQALEAVAGEGHAVADEPLHLTITGTTLEGEVKAYADHFGAVIPDVDHRARFRFRRGRVGEVPAGEAPADDLPWPDDFADVNALARLALAARSSASFPVAFEPSYCPVTEPPDARVTLDDTHPDLRGVASFTQSRWVIDGGVLVNTPFRPALDAIATLPAEGRVRRVLAYVVPHPIAEAMQPADRTALPSALAVAMDSGSRLPRVQSVGRELEEISANNQRVRRRRRSRACTLQDVDAERLEHAAKTFLHSYVCLRRLSAATDVIDLLLAGRRDQDRAEWRRRAAKADADGGGDGAMEPWRHGPSIAQVEEVRAALDRLPAPWLPPSDETILPESWSWSALPLDPWRWGLAPVEHAANIVLDLLRTAISLEELGPRSDAIAALRVRFHERLAELRRAMRRSEEYWHAQAGVLAAPEGLAAAVEAWAPIAGEARPIAEGLAQIVVDAWGVLSPDAPADGPAATLLARLQPLVEPVGDEEPGKELTVRRLLAVDVVQRSSGAELSGVEQEIELVLMSADAGNAFDPRSRAEQKLAGLQVAHFGSFYKRSWRANDWMWGRLDGADRLVRTLLDPRQIQRRLQAGEGALQAVAAEIQAIAAPPEPSGSLDASACQELEQRWSERADAVLAELRALKALPGAPQPTDLPLCHQAIRRRVQLEILGEEIANVRDAARADLVMRAAADSNGARWQAGVPSGPVTGPDAIAAFQSCHIGEEPIAAEVGSDLFTKVATTTLGVGGSVARGAVTFKAIQPVLSTVRGILLMLYLLARGVLTGSRTGSFLVALVLALGGALVALYLLGVRVPGVLALLGASLLIAAVLLGLVRRTWLRLVVVVALYAATLVAYYGLDGWDARPDWIDPVAGTSAVLVLALAATVLGYQGRRRPPPT